MRRSLIIVGMTLFVYLAGVLTGAVFWEARGSASESKQQRFSSIRQSLDSQCSEDEVAQSLRYFLSTRSLLYSSKGTQTYNPTFLLERARWGADDVVEGLYVLQCIAFLGRPK